MTKKTKIAMGLGALLLVALVLFRLEPKVGSKEEDKAATVSLVSASDFIQVEGYISAVGEVESVDQVTLSSEVSGTVQATYAEIGDYVTAGEVLIKLESGAYDAQLAQAAASIDRAQAALDQMLAGATDQEIAQSAASVDQAKANLAATQVAYEQAVLSSQESIDDAAAALATAENNLRQAEDGSSSELVRQEYIDLMNTIKGSYTVMTDILEDSDEILGMENEGLNDSFEDILSAQSQQALIDAENTYEQLQSIRDSELDAVNLLNSNSSYETLDSYSLRAESMLEVAEDHLYDMIAVMNNTPESASLSSTRINTYVGTYTGNLNSIQSKIAQLSDDQESVSAAEVSYSNAQIAYDSELLDYEQAQLSAEQSIASAAASVRVQEAALAAAEAAYDLITADPRDVDLASYQASIAEARASYLLASVNQNKTLITAPFSGQVSVMSLRAGDLVTAGQALVSIVNAEQLQVTSFIGAEDLKWIRIGDPVTVNQDISAEVYRVSPSLNPSTRKIEIQILITQKDADITVGEFVEMELRSSLVQEENKRFFLPLATIKVSSSKNYVYIVNDDGLIEQKEVELGEVLGETVEVLSGLSSEDFFISSVRGLSVGDRVNVINAVIEDESL